MDKVKFKIIALEPCRSTGSELEVGNVYVGEYQYPNRIFFTDRTGDEWVFYIDDTCILI